MNVLQQRLDLGTRPNKRDLALPMQNRHSSC